MLKYGISYVITGGAFGILDALWLRTMMSRLYKPQMGALLTSDVRMGPALVFYALYIAGILYFAVMPALAAGKAYPALFNGAILGFLCYMTYNLTNHAVMAQWSVKLSATDIVWGTVATGLAAFIGAKLTLMIQP